MNRTDVELAEQPEIAKVKEAAPAEKLVKGGVLSRSRDSVVGLLTGACLLGSMLPLAAGTEGDFTQSLVTAPAQDDWEFFFQLDGYAPWVEIKTPRGTRVDLGLDDIIDSLQMVAEFTVGVRKGKWGLQTQAIYVDLAGDEVGTHVNKVGLEEWFVSPAISYRFYEGEKGFFELMVGARYTWLDFTLKGTTPITGRFFKESAKGVIWDGLVGVNGDYKINEKWHLPFYAEVGTGDSDLISQGWAGVGYRLNPCSDVGLLFRVLYYDFGDEIPLDTEFVYGPHLYYRYTF